MESPERDDDANRPLKWAGPVSFLSCLVMIMLEMVWPSNRSAKLAPMDEWFHALEVAVILIGFLTGVIGLFAKDTFRRRAALYGLLLSAILFAMAFLLPAL